MINKTQKTPKRNNNSINKNKTPKKKISAKVKKIVQSGGNNNYYQQNDFQNNSIDSQTGGDLGLFSNSNLLLIIIIILLAIISYLLYMNFIAKNNRDKANLEEEINNALINEANNIKKHKKNLSKYKNNLNNKTKTQNTNENIENFNNAHPQYNLGHRFVGTDADNVQAQSMFIPVLNHAMERIINPLLPPERSYVNTYGIPTNIPSRGFVGGYQQVGSLNKTDIVNDDSIPGNNNKTVILPLFGQPTYPGSNKWNYYTTSDKHNAVKITFKVGNKYSDDRHGINELMTGDKLEIPEYNGSFDVKIYQFDQPRYIPYVY